MGGGFTSQVELGIAEPIFVPGWRKKGRYLGLDLLQPKAGIRLKRSTPERKLVTI
jgi:hypothetical protein